MQVKRKGMLVATEKSARRTMGGMGPLKEIKGAGTRKTSRPQRQTRCRRRLRLANGTGQPKKNQVEKSCSSQVKCKPTKNIDRGAARTRLLRQDPDGQLKPRVRRAKGMRHNDVQIGFQYSRYHRRPRPRRVDQHLMDSSRIHNL